MRFYPSCCIMMLATLCAVRVVSAGAGLLPRSSVYAPHGVVCASHPLACQAGLAVLERGGNAIDAAVTAAAVMNVVEPMTSGIGGDCFALMWIEDEHRLVGLNASGRFGSLLTPEAVRAAGFDRMPDKGAMSVTVPGTLSGWVALLERYGTISLSEALAPAIALAEDGFPLSPNTAAFWQSAENDLADDPATRAVFQTAAGRPPEVGEWMRNPAFARTLRTIAEQGPGVFYGGALGQRVTDYVQSLGGFITVDDLRNQEVDWVEPMSAAFGDTKLWELPPNGQGIAALEMVRILDGIDLKSLGRATPAYLHQLIEAKKIAYADLYAHVADPATMHGPAAKLLADGYITSRRALIDSHHASDRVEPGHPFTQGDTTYLTAADAHGNMVSFISSLCWFYGSGIVVPDTGFALQNRGSGFPLEGDAPNVAAPGRRPFHTIIPGFITRTDTDGSDVPWVSFGIMGGPNQPQAHVQVMLDMVLFGTDAQTAIDAPRFHNTGGLKNYYDAHMPAETITGLEALGHETAQPRADRPPGAIFGTGHIIKRLDNGGYEAGADSRSDGIPAGY